MTLPEPAQWVSFAAVAALVSLDGGPWLLSMAARPLPAATLVGIVWGDPVSGAIAGATLELVYAGLLPVGGARYPEAGLAGVVGGGVAVATTSALGQPSILAGLVTGLLAGEVGRAIEGWRRERNRRRVALARSARDEDVAGALSASLRSGLLDALALGVTAATLLLGLGLLLAAPLVDMAPAVAGARPPLPLLAGLACAAVFRLWPASRARWTLAAAGAIGFAVGLFRRTGGGT